MEGNTRGIEVKPGAGAASGHELLCLIDWVKPHPQADDGCGWWRSWRPGSWRLWRLWRRSVDFPSLPLAVTAQVFKLEAGPTYMRCPPLLPVWRIRLGVNLKLHKSVGSRGVLPTSLASPVVVLHTPQPLAVGKPVPCKLVREIRE